MRGHKQLETPRLCHRP